MAVDNSGPFIKISSPCPNVRLVELARKPVNAFTDEFWAEYGRVFDDMATLTEDIRAVVVSSAFPKIFSAGIDFQGLSSLDGHDTEPARRGYITRRHILEFQRAISAPERCPFPVVAAVHGMVIGLGIDIIAACDIRYAASDTTFSIKEVDVGLAADIGTLAHLPKITANQSLARELAYTARPFSSAEAEKLGLVSKVIDGGREAVVREALALAKVIASKSPVAVTGTKHLLLHARDHSVAENLEYTAIWNGAMVQSQDLKEAVKAGISKSKTLPVFPPLRSVPSKL